MTPFLLLAGVKALQSIGLRTIEVEDFGDPCGMYICMLVLEYHTSW